MVYSKIVLYSLTNFEAYKAILIISYEISNYGQLTVSMFI